MQCSGCKNVTNKTSNCSCCVPPAVTQPEVCPNASCQCRNVTTNTTTKAWRLDCNCSRDNKTILTNATLNASSCNCSTVGTGVSSYLNCSCARICSPVNNTNSSNNNNNGTKPGNNTQGGSSNSSNSSCTSADRAKCNCSSFLNATLNKTVLNCSCVQKV